MYEQWLGRTLRRYRRAACLGICGKVGGDERQALGASVMTQDSLLAHAPPSNPRNGATDSRARPSLPRAADRARAGGISRSEGLL